MRFLAKKNTGCPNAPRDLPPRKDGILHPRRVALGLPSPSPRVCTGGRTLTSQPKFLGSRGTRFVYPWCSASSAIIYIFLKLKCHWDQNFGIPCFYIFEHSLWFLVTMPNFNSLRQLEVALFGRFFSGFCGRHYWPLFRKLACGWASNLVPSHGYLPREIKLSSRKDFLPTVCCTTLKPSLLQQLWQVVLVLYNATTI